MEPPPAFPRDAAARGRPGGASIRDGDIGDENPSACDGRPVKGVLGGKYRSFLHNCFEILPRQALHARSLVFTHPESSKRMAFETPLPEDFEQILDRWRSYLA